jgi:ATP-dependent exoDNAse (exonuclease V) alpha subunit
MIIDKQQLAIDAINSGKNVFITGSGGVGKSWVIRQVSDKHTLLVAPTGIAAINIGGVTCHSAFGLPLGLPTAVDYSKISPALRSLFAGNSVKRIIIDEASMLRVDMLEMIDHKLKMVKGNKKPFGGIQVVMVGDFFQLEPIVQRQEQQILLDKYKSAFAFSSKAWNFHMIELTDVVRQSDAKQISLLQSIRKKTPESYSAIQQIQQQAKAYINDKDALHLCCYNADADAINQHWYSLINSKEKTYHGVGDNKNIPIDQNLKLKVGTKVLLCANDLEGQYVNGEKGEIVSLEQYGVVVKKEDGSDVYVTPFTWEKYKIKATPNGVVKTLDTKFEQLPIRLGWAISIHKSQGMTLDNVAIHTGKGCFGHGQLYVALSRIRDLNNLSFVQPLKESDLIVHQSVIDFYNQQ